MAFTYDPAALAADSAAGRLARVRLYTTDTEDTDDQPAIFQDAEINAFLNACGDDEYEAAAFAYETWARSRGRIAKMMRRDNFATERHAIDHLMAAAEKIRAVGRSSAGTVQTGQITISSPNEYLDSFRPSWRGESDWVLE